jgi:uncharacterized membrane protein
MSDDQVVKRLEAIEQRLLRLEARVGAERDGEGIARRLEDEHRGSLTRGETGEREGRSGAGVESGEVARAQAEVAVAHGGGGARGGRAVPPPLPVAKPAGADGGEVGIAGRLVEEQRGSLTRGESGEGEEGSGVEVLGYASPSPGAEAVPAGGLSKAGVGGGLEQTIGLKWAGWIGAVVLLVGAGLGVKFAYDQGWLGFLTPTVRVVLMMVGGFALIGAGEWVRARVEPLAATGLYGAGVALLFLSSYAGHGYYGLYESRTAFVLMAGATVIGAGVSLRGRLVSIAVLSLIGGNIAPALLGSAGSPLVAFLGYLLMLQVVALAVAGWGRAEKWWVVRWVSLVTTAVWVLVVVLSRGEGIEAWGAVLWFVLVYGVLYQLEVGVSSVYGGMMGVVEDPPEAGASGGLGEGLSGPGAMGALFCMLVTGLVTVGVLWLMRGMSDAVQGVWVVGIAVWCAVAGLVLGGVGVAKHLEEGQRGSLTRGGTGGVEWLAVGYRISAMVLLVVAVPVALGGAWVTLGWCALAVAYAVMGARVDGWLPRAAGIAAWGAAVVHLFMVAVGVTGEGWPLETWLTVLGQEVAAYLVLAGILVAVGHVVGWLTQSGGEEGEAEAPAVGWARVVSGLASGVWVVAVIAALPALAATMVLVGYAWAVALVDVAERGRRQAAGGGIGLWWQGMAVLGIAVVKWVVVDSLWARFSPEWSALEDAVLLNPAMGVGAAVVASLVGVYLLSRKRMEVQESQFGLWGVWLAAAVVVLIGFGLSLEVDRAVERVVASGGAFAWPAGQMKQMALTMLWSAAVGVLAGLVWKLERDVRRQVEWQGGLAAVAVLLAGKFVVVDTIWMGMGWLWGGGTPAQVLNFQTMAAAVVAGAAVTVGYLLPTGVESDDETAGQWRAGVLVRRFRLGLLAAGVIGWVGTLEIVRVADHGAMWSAGSWGTMVWPEELLALVGWTVWWMAVVVGFCLLMLRLLPAEVMRPRVRWLGVVAMVVGVKYLLLDTLGWRLLDEAVLSMVGLNWHVVAGLVVAAGLGLWWYPVERLGWWGLGGSDAGVGGWLRGGARLLAVLVLLWAGTMEIDRAFAHAAVRGGVFADPDLARQVGFSVFWSVFAIVSVVAGFRFRTASLRYFGLGLFAFTLLKVVIVDLGHVEAGYRVLSFIGLGLLLLGTSVLYGKLSPRLLGDRA